MHRVAARQELRARRTAHQMHVVVRQAQPGGVQLIHVGRGKLACCRAQIALEDQMGDIAEYVQREQREEAYPAQIVEHNKLC